MAGTDRTREGRGAAAAQLVAAIASAVTTLLIGGVLIVFMQQSEDRMAELIGQLRGDMRQSEERAAANLRQSEERMTELIGQLREDMRQSEERTIQLIGQLRGDMRQSEERMAANLRQAEARAAANLRESEARTAEEFRKTREEIARVEKRMNEQFAALAQRFDAYALQAERFRDDIRADYHALARGLEQAAERDAAIAGRMDDVERQFAALNLAEGYGPSPFRGPRWAVDDEGKERFLPASEAERVILTERGWRPLDAADPGGWLVAPPRTR